MGRLLTDEDSLGSVEAGPSSVEGGLMAQPAVRQLRKTDGSRNGLLGL